MASVSRMFRTVLSLFRSVLLLAATVSLASVGVAHQTGEPEMSPELAAYVAAGGLLDDICGSSGDPHRGGSVDCEMCRIADTLLDLRFEDHANAVDTPKCRAFRFVAKKIVQSCSLDPARLTRAPPQA
ncbi:MAG: hypothetical protein AB8B62_19425 [Roseobacter sp.]